MPFQVSPGVNVSEFDLTTIVPAVATTRAGISFPTEWGPANEAVLIDTPKTFREIFGDLKQWNAANYMTALNFLGYSQGLLMVRAMSNNSSNTQNANTGEASGQNAYAPTDAVDLTSKVAAGFMAKYAGEKGDSLAVSVARNGATAADWAYYSSFARQPLHTDNILTLGGLTQSFDQVHVAVIDEDGLFTGTKGEVLERFENVSLHPRARRADGTSLYIKNVLNNESQYIKVTGSLDSYDLDNDGFAEVFGSAGLSAGGVLNTNWETTYAFSFDGGAEAVTVPLSGGTGQNYTNNRTDPDILIGYGVLADSEKIDVNLLLGGDLETSEEVGDLKTIAETRKDCIAFVSCPVGKGASGVNSSDSVKADACIAFKDTVGSSSYVVIDSGYRKQFDPFNQVNRWVPLNGDTAGLCARTEFTNDAWWSPAGYNRGLLRNSGALAFSPNKTFRDRIYPKGINPIITERETGTLLLGDKTALSKPSAFDRINVRRLFIVLEKAISTASKYSLFEFNDAFTRARFISLISPYLEDVKSRRGLIDYKVVCDETNNTPERIDRNELWADIYIKPNRSINYVQLNFIATRTGANFNEIGA